MSKDSSSAAPLRVLRAHWFHKPARENLGHPLLIIFNVLLIFAVSQIFAAFIVQLVLSAAKLSHSTISNSAAAEFFYVLIAEGLAAGLVIHIVKSRQLSLKTIGLGRRPSRSDIYRAVGGFLAFYALLIIVAAVLTHFYPGLDKGTQDVGFENLHSHFDTILALFALVLLPPLGEEILVRGYLYSGLRQKMKFVPALLITSIFFGAAHLQTGSGSGLLWAAGLNTFVLSVVLVYLRESSGALYAGMIVHGLNNLIAFVFHFHLAAVNLLK